jgi:hypothetical protein
MNLHPDKPSSFQPAGNAERYVAKKPVPAPRDARTHIANVAAVAAATLRWDFGGFVLDGPGNTNLGCDMVVSEKSLSARQPDNRGRSMSFGADES